MRILDFVWWLLGAEISKAATNLTTLISDLGAYYTSQAKFADDLKTMTNVQLDPGTGLTSEIKAAGAKCIKVTLNNADAATKKPAVLKVENGSENTKPICAKVLANQGVDNLIKGKFKYTDNTGAEKDSDVGEVAISGIGVTF